MDPAGGRILFEDWVETWRKGLVGLRESTRLLNLSVVDNHLLPRFGGWPLSSISRQAVRAMVAEETESGRWGPSSLRRHVIVLKSIMGAAVEDGLIAVNPAERIPVVGSQPRDVRFLSAEDLAALADAIHPHYRVLVLTAGWMGCRWGELAGLGVEHVDLLRRQLRIERQLAEVGGRQSYGPPKTKASVRTIALPASLCVELESQLARDVVQSSGLVFPTVTGKPMYRANFREVWLEGCQRAGIGRLRFHDLRHTAAALAIEAGAHPLVVKERLGHSSITVTMDVYGGLFPRVDEALAEALDAKIQTSRGLLAASPPETKVRNLR